MPVDPARLAACFDDAVELDPPAQQALLADLDDPELRAELTRLLAHDRAHPEPVPTDMSAGTRIGELVILGKLGEGATSTVYAARDEALGRTVAIKQLQGNFAGRGSSDRQRIRNEARLLAHLAHPNVVALHELREHHGELLLIMEHVQGAPLGAWIAQTPHWRPRLAALLQAGRGLAAAHALGLTHGDFKPDNVLVGDDQRVRVVDFGLARLLTAPESATTRGGPIAGTPAFMAPEQFAGRPGDARSDQFAFCVTVYTCLFGQPPFPADTLPALVERLAAPPAPPPAHELPPALVAAVLRGLARDPEDRWPGMDALLAALEREHGRDPEDDLRLGRRQRRIATIGLLASASAIDAWIFLRPDAAPSQLAPRDLVVFMLVVMVLLLALVAGFWRAFRQNRANRQLIGVVLLALGAVLVHRLFALHHDTPPPHTLAVDLLIMATCAGLTALTFRRQFLAPALVFLLAAALAALAPERAPAVFSASSVTTFALVLLWWPRDGEL